MFINEAWDTIWLEGIGIGNSSINLNLGLNKNSNIILSDYGECITLDFYLGDSTKHFNLISIKELRENLISLRREIPASKAEEFNIKCDEIRELEDTLKYIRTHVQRAGISKDRRAYELMSVFSKLGLNGFSSKDMEDFKKFSPKDKNHELTDLILSDIQQKNFARVDQIEKSTSYNVTIGIIERAKEQGYIFYLQAYMVAKAGGKHLR
jgi:hypothetical protein